MSIIYFYWQGQFMSFNILMTCKFYTILGIKNWLYHILSNIHCFVILVKYNGILKDSTI
jgi:hypothetical protein